MRISIVGSRGIPAQYGGFEVFTEELSTRLVQKGHQVNVSCEYKDDRHGSIYKGVNLHFAPCNEPRSYSFRKLYELVADIYFMIKLARKSDVMYLLGMTAGFAVFVPKLINWRLKIFINIDGVEWKREKFNILERAILHFNTLVAALCCDTIVLDAQSMQKYIFKRWVKKSVFIPYGTEIVCPPIWDNSKLETLRDKNPLIQSITENGYWLVVARLEPENNIHIIVDGFLRSNPVKPLIVVGNFTDPNYRARIEKILDRDKSNRIILTGGIYNNDGLLNMLRHHCYAYIHGHSVGGTNPSLLEIMSMRTIIVAHDNVFNREVCKDGAFFFRTAEDLATLINGVNQNGEDFSDIRDIALQRVKNNYNWGSVANRYERAFLRLI